MDFAHVSFQILSGFRPLWIPGPLGWDPRHQHHISLVGTKDFCIVMTKITKEITSAQRMDGWTVDGGMLAVGWEMAEKTFPVGNLMGFKNEIKIGSLVHPTGFTSFQC